MFKKILASVVVAGLLAACGGGGGSPSVPAPVSTAPGTTTPSTDTGTTTPTTPVAAASITTDVLSGSGASTASISTAEIAQVKAVLKDATGAVVKGAIVTFSEVGGPLLTFSPAAKTALTDASGVATVEVRAASASSAGATTVVATATVGTATVTGQKAIAISSAPASGVVDPQALANALNFLDVNPADRSIVLAGSGGNGRSESATLRFRVVDRNNSPVKGTTVTFAAVPADAVTLNVVNATSDSDGVVVTTVSSKNVATAVVVRATVDGKTITSQSDQLTITTGVATQTGFDMSASKYNLNAQKTGDTSSLTVRIVDANGNPVADGVPVVFTANFGAVGTSSRGGCVTAGGSCTVNYVVQDPRPPVDGQLATVTASTRVATGSGTSISKSLNFRYSDVGLLNLFELHPQGSTTTAGTAVVTNVPVTCSPATVSRLIGTPGNLPAPANTAVTVTRIGTTGPTVAVAAGGTVLDQLSAVPSKTLLDLSIDASAATSPVCVQNGANVARGAFDLIFTADGISQTRRITVSYPTN